MILKFLQETAEVYERETNDNSAREIGREIFMRMRLSRNFLAHEYKFVLH
jgi:hypothetical protein